MTNWELIRKKLGLTLQEVGDSIGLSKQHLSKLERANKIPLEKSEELAKAFEYPCVRALKEDIECDLELAENVYMYSIKYLEEKKINIWTKDTDMDGEEYLQVRTKMFNYFVQLESELLSPWGNCIPLMPSEKTLRGFDLLIYPLYKAKIHNTELYIFDFSSGFQAMFKFNPSTEQFKLLCSTNTYPKIFEFLDVLRDDLEVYDEKVKEKLNEIAKKTPS